MGMYSHRALYLEGHCACFSALGPMLGLMLHFVILKFLKTSEKGACHISFALGPTNSEASPARLFDVHFMFVKVSIVVRGFCVANLCERI